MKVNNLLQYNSRILKQQNSKINYQNNLKKTSFKSKKDNNKDFVSINMPLPYINNFLTGVSLFFPIIGNNKNDKLASLGGFGIGMLNCFLPNSKEIIEVDKTDNRDIAVKKHFIKKQGLEAIILAASSILTTQNISENKCSSSGKKLQITTCVAAWGVSILNNILGYKKYKESINSGNYKK